jgi:predicted Fe-Mo cluster-binding NifX family protein
MKIIITSTGDTLNSKFDLRFGRSGWFCVYDDVEHSTQFIENANKNANGGAGTKTAEMIAELEANRVISGDFGPKAKSLLNKLKIQMIIMDGKNKTIQEIIDTIKN